MFSLAGVHVQKLLLESYLEVPPCLLVRFETSRDVAKLVLGHLWEVVVVDERAAARRFTANDVTACGLCALLSI